MKFLTLLSCICISIFSLNAQDGTLDLNFGDNGITIMPYFGENAQIQSILKLGNEIYAAGYTKEDNEDFSIVKLDLAGNQIADFGDNGLLRFSLFSGFGQCSKLLQHPDGDIIVIGWDRNIGKVQYVILKMDRDGNLDLNYGEDGISSGNWSGSSFAESQIRDAVILSDGRLIGVGRSYNGQNTDFVVACFDESGNPCTDFGTDGLITQEFTDGNNFEIAMEVAKDADDNLYVGGNYRNLQEGAYRLVKYDSAGNLLPSFGSSGFLDFSDPSNPVRSLGDISIDKNNRLVVSGQVNANNRYAFIRRYDLDGNADNSFGNNGIVTITAVNTFGIDDAHILNDNSIILAGSTSGFGTRQILAKIDNTGDLVSSFGNNGITSELFESTFNGISEIAVDADGIFAGGYTHNGDNFKLAVSKFSGLFVSTKENFYSNLDMDVFPNPVGEILNIEHQVQIHSLRILDNSGKEIYTLNSKNLEKNVSVPVHDWQSGIYHVILISEQGSNKTKFIKL